MAAIVFILRPVHLDLGFRRFKVSLTILPVWERKKMHAKTELTSRIFRLGLKQKVRRV